ncbi:hypothetical protein BKP42_41120 [Rhodococcus erythropolis]|nr:hypothetical protein BKP42_41120 [Rhodococcus erythropolis]
MLPDYPRLAFFERLFDMTAALESRTETARPTVAWTVPKHPLPGFTWYEPGEYVNPETGEVEGDVMCTF